MRNPSSVFVTHLMFGSQVLKVKGERLIMDCNRFPRFSQSAFRFQLSGARSQFSVVRFQLSVVRFPLSAPCTVTQVSYLVPPLFPARTRAVSTNRHEKSADHWHYRPGRFVSGRAFAQQRIRSSWPDPPRLFVQHRTARTDL